MDEKLFRSGETQVGPYKRRGGAYRVKGGAYTGWRRGIGTAVIVEEGGTHRHREGESPRRFAGCSLQWFDPTTTLHYNI